MGKPRVILAVSPQPAMLMQAARTHGRWQELAVAGSKQIHRLADRWAAAGEPLQVWLLLGDVTEPAALRLRLAALSQAGVVLDWFAPAGVRSVRTATQGLAHVTLHTAETPAQAFALTQQGRAVDDDPGNADLMDYLRYQVTLCFMRGMHPAPLEEAAATLARSGARRFTLEQAAPADARSVEHFRLADFPYIEGQSPAVMALKRRIVQVAEADLSALVLGETGTGKEFVAFYLHEFSPRRSGPFVSINCAGLDETFLRSELFGHEKGAFTGAIRRREGLVRHAEGGTLFLDELAEMPLPIQADLLRFLQSRRYRPLGEETEQVADVRIVAGTQPTLREKMRNGEFRQDLYFRLAEVELTTPPLAAVPEDIFRIVRHVTHRMVASEEAQAVLAYFARGEKTLRKHPWPGNVRELISLVRRRIKLGDDVIGELKAGWVEDDARPETGGDPLRIEPVEAVVRRYVARAHAARGALSQAELAQRLGLSVNTMKKYLSPEEMAR